MQFSMNASSARWRSSRLFLQCQATNQQFGTWIMTIQQVRVNENSRLKLFSPKLEPCQPGWPRLRIRTRLTSRWFRQREGTIRPPVWTCTSNSRSLPTSTQLLQGGPLRHSQNQNRRYVGPFQGYCGHSSKIQHCHQRKFNVKSTYESANKKP